MSGDQLIVFVKAPRPGAVKTRLAKSVGDEAACEAYRHLVQVLLEKLDSLRCVELRFSPDDAGDEIRPWQRQGWIARPQRPGDLGARLSLACDEAFAAGVKHLVIIGSDCPHVIVDDIHAAHKSLRSHDLVLGPATDGGYWLIGLQQPRPALFTNVPWSTNQVFSATLERAREAGLSVKILRELADVDTEADWREFQSENERGLNPQVG